MRIEAPELVDDRVVIHHDDPDYGPWVVRAVRPRWRDIWRILRRTYEPQVAITRSLTVAGMNKMLKSVYHPGILEALDARSPLMDLFDGSEVRR